VNGRATHVGRHYRVFGTFVPALAPDKKQPAAGKVKEKKKMGFKTTLQNYKSELLGGQLPQIGTRVLEKTEKNGGQQANWEPVPLTLKSGKSTLCLGVGKEGSPPQRQATKKPSLRPGEVPKT